MPHLTFSSLRFRVVLVAAFAVVPSLVLIVWQAVEQRQDDAGSVSYQAIQYARAISASQTDVINNTQHTLMVLSRLPEVSTGNRDHCGVLLADVHRESNGFTNLWVQSPDDVLTCSAIPINGNISVKDRFWFQQVIATHAFTVGDYSIGRASGKPTLTAAYPIVNEHEELLGIVAAGISLDWLSNRIARADLPPGASITLVDRKGTVLAHYPEHETWVGTDVQHTPIAQAMRNEREGTIETAGFDGIQRLYSFTSLEPAQTGVSVAIGVPTDLAYGAANRTLNRNLVGLALIAVLAIAAAWYGSGWFVLRPINALIGATARLKTGDLTARVSRSTGAGELNSLADSVNEMASSLEEQQVELARTNAELQQFAYVASHDLQEPLRIIASYTQLLARKYHGALDEKADRYINHTVEAAERMRNLIEDLLAYSRVGSRARVLVPTDAGAAFEAAVANLQVAIAESDATVSADPLPCVPADGTQLTQVFQNLIGNALKFRGEGPPRIHVGVERHDGMWQFAVRDNGIGIDPRYGERIFVVFQRLHTRQEYAGTGMGLAICKKIVERHGGRIWVESTPAEGATFRFTLPAGEGMQHATN